MTKTPRTAVVNARSNNAMAVAASITLALAASAHSVTALAADRATILVGPNILVSRDVDAPHDESQLVADPTNSNHLLGAVTTAAQLGQGMHDKTWTSFDGGYTWSDATPVGLINNESGDPQVAIGPTGTAFFITLVNTGDAGMHFYRSTDGGLSWGKPLLLGRHDAPEMSVDLSRGPHRGRVYIWVEGRDPAKRIKGPTVQLYRSDDDGRSFYGPRVVVSATTRKASRFNMVNTPGYAIGTLSDGTIVGGFMRYTVQGAKAASRGRLAVVTSPDGGDTWSEESVVSDYTGGQPPSDPRNGCREDLRWLGTLPYLAIDPSSGPFRNRIYALWSDNSAGVSKLFLAHSATRGRAWTRPLQIDANSSASVGDFQPIIAVNNKGVVGVLFYRAPGVSGGYNTFDTYFTASMDGGKTLLPPVRVSTRTSLPYSSGNVLVRARLPGHSATDVSAMLLPSSYNGGDYLGMAADGNGVFHPFWVDSRSGTLQVYTAPVTVATQAWQGPRFSSSPQLLDRKVEVVFDSSRCDLRAEVCTLPIRIKNVSNDSIYGPLTMRFKGASALSPGMPPPAYSVLNADNGKRHSGAAFDYTAALGSPAILPPHGLSGSVDWRFQFRNLPCLLTTLHFDVTGYVAPARQGKY